MIARSPGGPLADRIGGKEVEEEGEEERKTR